MSTPPETHEPVQPPTLKVTGGVYSYIWHEQNVYMVVERIREDSRHTPTADIRIRARPQGHLHMTRINLLSTQARTQVAKHCHGRDPVRDWDAMVEQCCVMTLDHWRKGEPLVKLGAVNPPLEPAYRLKPFLLEQEATLIYGEGGIGKSYLAAYLAAQIDQGIKIGPYEPVRGRVLYLDYETNAEIAARRFQALTKGFGFETQSEVLYRFCFQPLASDIAEIQKIVAEEEIECIVIDSAGPACGGDPESAASAINYFTALRSLRTTSLTIAHRSKGGSIGPFGSVYWVNYPRAVYELKKSQEVGQDLMDVALIHQKANEGRLQEPVSFKFQFSPGVVVAKEQALDKVPAFVSELPIGEQLEIAIREEGPMTAKALAEETGLNIKSIQVILSRQSRFKNIGGNRWDIERRS